MTIQWYKMLVQLNPLSTLHVLEQISSIPTVVQFVYTRTSLLNLQVFTGTADSKKIDKMLIRHYYTKYISYFGII